MGLFGSTFPCSQITPLLKSAYDGIGKPLPQLHALEGIHMLVVCHALHIIKHADLGQSVFRPRLVDGLMPCQSTFGVCTQHPNVVMPSCFSRMLYPA